MTDQPDMHSAELQVEAPLPSGVIYKFARLLLYIYSVG